MLRDKYVFLLISLGPMYRHRHLLSLDPAVQSLTTIKSDRKKVDKPVS